MSIYNSIFTPVTQNANATIDAECEAAAQVGDAVRVNSSGLVVRAIANAYETSLVLGVVEQKISETFARVRLSGVTDEIFSGLPEATVFFLSATTPGALESTSPTESGQVAIKVGQSFGANKILVQVGDRIRRA